MALQIPGHIKIQLYVYTYVHRGAHATKGDLKTSHLVYGLIELQDH